MFYEAVTGLVKGAKGLLDDKDEVIKPATDFPDMQSEDTTPMEFGKVVPNVIPTSVPISSPNITVEMPGAPANPTDAPTSVVETPTAAESPSTGSSKPAGLPIPNPLNVYASYNYIFTLCCLTHEEINNPWTTYRIKTPENIVLRSGGTPNAPGVLNSDNWDSKLEYFVDNITIEALISPATTTKHTNATNISFDVIEPYGLGTFIESLMKAAQKSGHANYSTAPFLIIIDFIGWDDTGKSVNNIDTGLRRTIPIKFSNVTFSVNESGSQYKVEAYPWNEQATLIQKYSLKNDRKIRGRTVKECCQSGFYAITTAFNNREQKKRLQNPSYVPDEFVIIFPKPEDETDMIEKIGEGSGNTSTKFDFEGDSINAADTGKRAVSAEERQRLWGTVTSAIIEKSEFKDELEANESIIILRSTMGEKARNFADDRENTNDIGSAKIVENPQDQVKHPMMTPMFAELRGTREGVFDRNNIKISDDLAEFDFKTGTTIEDMIEEIILMSEYGRKLLEVEPDAQGFIKWFKIETYLLSIKSDIKQKTEGRDAHVYIYQVVPYKTHKSRFVPVTNVIDISALEDQCVKQYDYIYTGHNDSIIKFDIQINSGFFVALNNTHTGKHGSRTKKSDSRGRQAKPTELIQTEGQGAVSANGHRPTQSIEKNLTSRQGGGHHENEKIVAARNFNDNYLNSGVDMIQVDMEIMGDPYFLTDSGTGNYRAKPGEYINLSKDGTMYIHNGEVDVKVNFKTPIDYGYNPGKGDKEGHLKFDDAIVSTSYSGVYQVIDVTSRFSQGLFTQSLTLVRRPMQSGTDTKEAPGDEQKLITEGGERKQFNDDVYVAQLQGGYAQGAIG